MDRPEIVIKTDGICNTRIFVDGKELDGVRSFYISQDAGMLPELHLSMVATDLTLKGKCLLKLPEIYERCYKMREPSFFERLSQKFSNPFRKIRK